MPYPDNNFSGQIEGEVIVYGKDTCIFTAEVAGRWCSHRCLSFCSEVPMWPLPMMHWTSLYRALPSPHIRPKTPLEQHRGVITGDLFKLVHLMTFPSDIWWLPLKYDVRFPGAWYASYWNAFLFLKLLAVLAICHVQCHWECCVFTAK